MPGSGNEKINDLETMYAASLRLKRTGVTLESLKNPQQDIKIGVTTDFYPHLFTGEKHSHYFEKMIHSGVDSVGVLLWGNMFRPKDKKTQTAIPGQMHVEFSEPDNRFTVTEDFPTNVPALQAVVVRYLQERVQDSNLKWTVQSFKNREAVDPRTTKRPK